MSRRICGVCCCARGIAASARSAISVRHERTRMSVHGRAGPASLRPDRTLIQQATNRAANALDEEVPVVERQARGGNRLSYSDAHTHRTDDGASLAHGGAAALYGDRDDGHLRLDRHDEAALLEWQQVAGAAARP